MNKIVIALILTVGVIFQAVAGNIPPKPQTAVNDYAGVLDGTQKRTLEQMLTAYKDSTSNEIAIVIEQSLDGDEAFTRSIDIAENWGVGGKQNDNGILLYVAIADRQMFIQVGRGLEGAIPDALAGRIIDYEIKPYFKQQNYYGGLLAGTQALMKAAAGEYTPSSKKGGKGFPSWILILFFIFILIILSIGKRMRGGFGTYGGGGYIGGWGGGWGGGGHSRGGGGFGGFGGGSFGGGGAGGSW